MTFATGTVKWFNITNGNGYITLAGSGDDIFVHLSTRERLDFGSIELGQSVTFDIRRDGSGRDAATAVTVSAVSADGVELPYERANSWRRLTAAVEPFTAKPRPNHTNRLGQLSAADT
ncbi:cold shock domain-containing protein [Cereibacter johrii]|uniref:cold shock domain-containing protein n=1 Tax=Cereibacter johrii TaxID=445629 RepID=UPI003CFAEBFA